MKIADYEDGIPALVLGILLGLLVFFGPTWPAVMGVVAITVLICVRRMVPDRRAPKVETQTVMAMVEDIRRLRDNVSNLNMIVGLKGAPKDREPAKPVTP